MSIINLEDFSHNLTKNATFAGLDLGTKTIGLALSDIGLHFAHPYSLIRREKFSKDAEKLLYFFNKENVALIVIGLPLNMNGTSGPRAQATRAFVRNMEKHTPIPFVYWDERLSTVAAERNLTAMNMTRAKRAEKIDSHAAAFILQGALDRFHDLKKRILPVQASDKE